MPITVAEAMTPTPACATADTMLQEVARLMVDHNCGCIPVIDEQGAPIGVVTDRDIVCRVVAHDDDPRAKAARDAMTPGCITVREDASLESCCQLLEQHQIRRAVVVDRANHVVGIVAQADLARTSETLGGEVVAAVSAPSIRPSANL